MPAYCSAAQGGAAASQSPWLLLPLLALGEMPHYSFPNSLQWTCMIQPRNVGELSQEGNFDQWETEAEDGSGLKNPLSSSDGLLRGMPIWRFSADLSSHTGRSACCVFPGSSEQHSNIPPCLVPILSCLCFPFLHSHCSGLAPSHEFLLSGTPSRKFLMSFQHLLR